MTNHTRLTVRAFVPLCLCAFSLSFVFAQDGLTPAETAAAIAAAPLPIRDRVELAERLRGVPESAIEPTPAAPPALQLGDRRTFSATGDEQGTFTITAELRGLGRHLQVWVEESEIPDYNDTITQLIKEFDDNIYPNVRGLWGEEPSPGIDGDERVVALFARGLGDSVAAYFASDNVYPRAVVPTSNEAEMFFFNLDAVYDYSLTTISSVFAHEFQHMIRHQVQLNEETWINEGFSTFTENYFYDTVDYTVYEFMNAPYTQLNSWAEEGYLRGANYGAAQLFVTYFYDRYGEDALRLLSADPAARALDGVESVLEAIDAPETLDTLFADWVVTNAVNDPRLEDGRYAYAHPNLAGVESDVLELVRELPFTIDQALPPYAADVYVLDNLDGAEALDLSFGARGSLPVLDLEADGAFWYSNRGDMSDSTLTRAFDLSNVDDAELSFRVWHDLEDEWDYAYVMASRDDGETWDVLRAPGMIDNDPNDTAYGIGFTGESGGWMDAAIRLDSYAGGEVLIRFEMITDDAINRPGMAIDDVRIDAIDYADDAESDAGGWDAAGWVRISNAVPLGFWVQVVTYNDDREPIALARWRADGNPELADKAIEAAWSLPLPAGTVRAMVIVAPTAPVTTETADYTLTIE